MYYCCNHGNVGVTLQRLLSQCAGISTDLEREIQKYNIREESMKQTSILEYAQYQ